MATHQIHFRVKGFLVLLVVILTLYALTKRDTKIPEKRCYRYGIGMLNIDNPKLVVFKKGNCEDFEQDAYVCSLSTLLSCKDSAWTEREDVYPYISHIHSNIEKQPISNIQGGFRSMFESDYRSFYKTSDFFYGDTTISVYRFYYNLNAFDAYMQAIDGYWYDPSDPNFENPWADCYDAFAYSNKYRIAVTPHYTWWQMFKLFIAHKIREISRYDYEEI